MKLGKFRREFRNVLGRGHCLITENKQRNRKSQSQNKSRHINEDQELSYIHSTTHMIHITQSIKKTTAVSFFSLCLKKQIILFTKYLKIFQIPQNWQTSFITNGNNSIENQQTHSIQKTSNE